MRDVNTTFVCLEEIRLRPSIRPSNLCFHWPFPISPDNSGPGFVMVMNADEIDRRGAIGTSPNKILKQSNQ